ncbi:MAG: carbon-nitrogen hydrolase family protein [Kiloniellaceae bacterium]
MSTSFKAACIQNCATPDVARNLDVTLRLTREAAAAGADLICLPEYFSGVETRDGLFHPAAFPEESHPVLPAFAAAARELGAWLHLGSLGVRVPGGRILNRGYVLSPDGEIAARYDKIHLFDVNLGAGREFRESATIAPGHEAVVVALPWTAMGLSICYDLRFAALYRDLARAGARVLAIPAAFTKLTGQAHWHVLNRARAIETGSFVIAPCQFGTLAGGGACYGHSLIVDPWGRVLADGGEDEGSILAEIDPGEADAARGRIPALSHDRPFAPAAQALDQPEAAQ